MHTQFDDTELLLHEAEKARRRRRYEERTGAVHTRRNKKNRRADALNKNSKYGQRAIRAEVNA